MRRLVFAAILALAAHGLLFLSKAPWVLPRTTPPRWSVKPVVVELGAPARIPEKPVRISSGQRAVSYEKKPKPLPAKEPRKKPTRRLKTKSTVKPRPRKAKKLKRVKKVRMFAMKKPAAKPAVRCREPKKESQIVRPDNIQDVEKKPGTEPRHVSGEPTSNSVPDTGAPLHKHTTWEDIPDDILAEAPQGAVASLFHATGQEEALVEARPSYLENTPPAYPLIARERGYEGTVILEVLVNSEGRVGDIRLFKSSGYKILDKAALRAVRHWIFEPGRRGNTPIEMWVKVPVRFVLK